MYIEYLGNRKNIKCKQCGYSRVKSKGKNKKDFTTIYGVWSNYSKDKEPDYILCKDCFNKLLDCVRGISV